MKAPRLIISIFLLILVGVLLVTYMVVRLLNVKRIGVAPGINTPLVQVPTPTSDPAVLKKAIEGSPEINIFESSDTKVAEVRGVLITDVMDGGLVYTADMSIAKDSIPPLHLVIGSKAGEVLFGEEKLEQVTYHRVKTSELAEKIKKGDTIIIRILVPKELATATNKTFIEQQNETYQKLKNLHDSGKWQDVDARIVVDQIGVLHL
jgi:hypothetical protein